MSWKHVALCLIGAVFAGLALDVMRFGISLTLTIGTICCAIDGAAEAIKRRKCP